MIVNVNKTATIDFRVGIQNVSPMLHVLSYVTLR